MNCALSAHDFILELGKVYGEGIFKAILEQHDDRYVEKYDQFKMEAMNSGLPHFAPNQSGFM